MTTPSKRMVMRGNEAIAQAAMDAGCRAFFGYPITPQNQIPDYLALHMPKVGGVFLQAESEVAAINMVYGAAAAGVRTMTASSSPGVSLKQEGISYLAGAELPCVIVNVMRGGSGLGNIAPSQSDYFQAVKGGGHGDYRTLVLAPWSVQELYDLTRLAFELADEYRNPVLLLAYAVLGQMMEPLTLPEDKVDPATLPAKPWATTGCEGRARNIINSLYIVPEDLEKVNLRMAGKYEQAKKDLRWEETDIAGAEYAVVAYGTAARITMSALELAREKGLRVGLFRPITLYPFPELQLRALARKMRGMLSFELSLGQFVEDVRLAANGACPVHFFGRAGGVVPGPKELLAQIEAMVKEVG